MPTTVPSSAGVSPLSRPMTILGGKDFLFLYKALARMNGQDDQVIKGITRTRARMSASNLGLRTTQQSEPPVPPGSPLALLQLSPTPTQSPCQVLFSLLPPLPFSRGGGGDGEQNEETNIVTQCGVGRRANSTDACRKLPETGRVRFEPRSLKWDSQAGLAGPHGLVAVPPRWPFRCLSLDL